MANPSICCFLLGYWATVLCGDESTAARPWGLPPLQILEAGHVCCPHMRKSSKPRRSQRSSKHTLHGSTWPTLLNPRLPIRTPMIHESSRLHFGPRYRYESLSSDSNLPTGDGNLPCSYAWTCTILYRITKFHYVLNAEEIDKLFRSGLQEHW